MHLVRVQVPNFRALNQVDITFEKDFFPQIFPIGSQNGGGKSTLLQLIFVLLHCSAHSIQFDFLKYFLLYFKLPENSDSKILAEIDIDDNGNLINLIFSCRRYSTDPRKSNFDFENPNLILIYEYNDDDPFKKPVNRILVCQINYLNKQSDNFKNETTKNQKILSKISENIFLVAPSTQVFLFLPATTRQLLFRQTNKNSPDYHSQLNLAKSKLNNFFTYDFLAVDLLVQAFKSARDQDFMQAIETGQYGSNYQNLMNELNKVLVNKKINISKDLEGLTFQLDQNGQTIELNPEDLSHGELKRLSIYTWLKHNKIKDAIVLMDEIEIALHPDWQYQIISDLQEWEPSNQYILATHSYELCQALTPAHVKEIEPKLIKNKD